MLGSARLGRAAAVSARRVPNMCAMVYPADDLLLRARLMRKAAREMAMPRRTLLDEISGLIAEVEGRVRENAAAEGDLPSTDGGRE